MTCAEFYASDPLTSVALGAARLAEIKRVGGLVVTNKVAKSIGVRVHEDDNDDVYHVVIHRGEDRPVRREVKLTTNLDLQDIVEIEIREGDNTASAQSNTLLARLNAIVRPETKGTVKLRIQLSLSDAGAMEAYVEPLNDSDAVREVKASGIRIKKGQRETATGELRTGDPVAEFKDEVIKRNTDPDTARQVYERLKIKYHPARSPKERDHWAKRLSKLDDAFNRYLEDVERRVRASSVPDLPWENLDMLHNLVVDEVLAHCLTHCLANGIGTEDQRLHMPNILRRYADYRRVLASYLFGIKRNTVLQDMLSKGDRPHVGLVVLLQNLPDKPIRERHEVLKAAYRVKENKVRDMLRNPNIDIEALYSEVPKVAEAPIDPMGERRGQGGSRVKLNIEHKNGNTYITGNTYPARFQIKTAIRDKGGKVVWDGKNKQWIAEGATVTEEDIFG
jgi:hypothetical protein